jgi:hypothetical protein
MGGSGYGEKTAIAPNTFTEEYVYNAYNYQDAPNHFIDMSKKELEISTPPGDTNIPSVAKEQVQVGHVIGNNGKFYTDAETCVDATKANPVAAVLYVGEKGSVEEGKDYFGMAMSLVELNNDGNGYTWSDSSIDEASICAPIAEEGKYSTYKNGIATTASMAAGCNANHTHLAAQACHNYTALGENARNQNGFSDWFIPSTGQWIMMAKNVGYTWQENENLFSPKNNGVYATWLSGQTFYKYMSARSISGIFWLSNTMNESHYYAYTFNLSYFTFSPTDNTHTSNVRPFIAF